MTEEFVNPFADIPDDPTPADPFADIPDDPDPEDKRNVVGDVALGALVYAPGAMAQGLSEIAAAGFDMAFGTNTAQEVTEFYDGVLEYVKPETTAGQVAAVGSEIGTMFIPFIGWASTAHKAAKAAKAGAVNIEHGEDNSKTSSVDLEEAPF